LTAWHYDIIVSGLNGRGFVRFYFSRWKRRPHSVVRDDSIHCKSL